jgi:tetratricopeptide (TPR) repeat protein
MVRALQDGGDDVRRRVVTDISFGFARLEQALPVLRAALAVPGNHRWMATTELERRGRGLLPVDAEHLERDVASRPEDSSLRILLLGYYPLPSHRSEAARAARLRHVLWAIEHAPELATVRGSFLHLHIDPVRDRAAYEQARGLWLARLDADPDNATLLGKAAEFFTSPDPGLSEELYRRAAALETQDPEWPAQLGRLYWLGARRAAPDDRAGASARALAELERAAGLDPKELRQWLLPDLARTAFEAGAWDRARDFAELLGGCGGPGREGDEDGMAVHYGNLVLGLLALRSGDVAAAKDHLLASARTVGSPTLCSFGPNMSLARVFLEAGEREVVAEYLRLCGAFWHTPDHRAEQWAYAVEHGAGPDFGANLDY